MRRRSLSNPGRIEHRRTTQLLKSGSSTSAEGSHIPRPRIRSLSTDRLSGRKSFLKSVAKSSTGHQHAPTTPKTPSYPRSNILQMSTSRLGPSPSAERASLLALSKAHRKDTRPITDKTFQAQMLRKIDNYFFSINQSKMLNSNGSIKPITTKMFVDVTSLLIGLLGINQTLTNLNYVEELPKIAKKLLYPGQMVKSWLKTANAMHAWPNVLAWLSWLVELCELRDIAANEFKIENLPFSNFDGQAERHRNTFFSLLKFYNAWNEEKLELEENLVSEFLKSEELRYNVSKEAYETACRESQAALEKLKIEDEERRKVDMETKELEEQLSALEKDYNKVVEFNKQQDERLRCLEEEKAQIRKDIAALDREVEKHLVKQSELMEIIKNQPISSEKRDMILAKCDDLKTYLAQFEEHLQSIQKDIYSYDMKLSAAHHNLNKVILDYNRNCYSYLESISDETMQTVIMPENLASDPDALDIFNEITGSLCKLKARFKKEFEELEGSLVPCCKNLEKLKDRVRILSEEKKELEQKSMEKKEIVERIKSQGRAREVELKDSIRNTEQFIKSLKEKEPDLKALETEYNDKIDKRDSLKRRQVFLKERGHQFFDKLFTIFTEHKAELSKQVDRLAVLGKKE